MSLILVSDDGELIRLQALGRVSGTGSAADLDPIRILLGHSGYARKVILDLGQTEFLDSAGIGWLLACHKRFTRAGGILVLHSMPDPFLLTFKMLKLQRVFHLASDDAEAEQRAVQAGSPPTSHRVADRDTKR